MQEIKKINGICLNLFYRVDLVYPKFYLNKNKGKLESFPLYERD